MPENEVQSIQLEAKTNNGETQKVILKARTVEPFEGRVKKVDASNADSSYKENSSIYNENNLVSPPHELYSLSRLWEESSELGQNISAMVTNTVGFGWQLKERYFPNGQREKHEDGIEEEKGRLKALLDSLHPIKNLTMLMKSVKWDQHSNGNGYLELIENSRGELVGTNHIFGFAVRITKKDNDPTKILVPRVRPDKNYTIENVPMLYRFRRYAVLCGGDKKIWFKEAGDPRTLDKKTGEFSEETLPENKATSLIHFRHANSISPYGLPVYMGNLFSIYGSREAEEVNYDTLKNNDVPSMFVICENGALTDASIKRLREWTEQQIQRAKNRSKFIILEGDTMEEGSPNPSDFKIKVEELKHIQQDDQLFQNYDKNNASKIRQSFRLPPIFLGNSDNYNRSVADSSRDVANEQVFAPERSDDDHMINRFILSRWDTRYHLFKFNHANITDDIELIRLMGISERSGGMTPRRADAIVKDVFGDNIGPMPQGIELDRPYSIQFAEAQKGVNEPALEGDKLIDKLLDVKKSLVQELDNRFFDKLEEFDEE